MYWIDNLQFSTDENHLRIWYTQRQITFNRHTYVNIVSPTSAVVHSGRKSRWRATLKYLYRQLNTFNLLPQKDWVAIGSHRWKHFLCHTRSTIKRNTQYTQYTQYNTDTDSHTHTLSAGYDGFGLSDQYCWIEQRQPSSPLNTYRAEPYFLVCC